MIKELISKLFKQEQTYLFIDGSNLYAGQFELFGPKKYLYFPQFVIEIKKQLNVHFDKILVYASYSPKSKKPTKKQKAYLRNEALFYRSVKQTPKVKFFKGYRSKISGKEKEVDVKLAVDMVDFAHRRKYRNIYLMSGDADFMEALHAVKRLDVQIKTLCIENKIIIKSLLFYPMIILLLNKTKISIKKIRKSPMCVKIKLDQVIKSV